MRGAMNDMEAFGLNERSNGHVCFKGNFNSHSKLTGILLHTLVWELGGNEKGHDSWTSSLC